MDRNKVIGIIAVCLVCVVALGVLYFTNNADKTKQQKLPARGAFAHSSYMRVQPMRRHAAGMPHYSIDSIST